MGLWRVVHRFHPLVACVQEVFPKSCLAHDTCHDKVVALFHHLGITAFFPSHVETKASDYTMAACTHDWQVHQTHAWMECGHFTLSQAAQALWPIPPWMEVLPEPKMGVLKPAQAMVSQLHYIPPSPYFTDGASYPDHSCGGATPVGSQGST